MHNSIYLHPNPHTLKKMICIHNSNCHPNPHGTYTEEDDQDKARRPKEFALLAVARANGAGFALVLIEGKNCVVGKLMRELGCGKLMREKKRGALRTKKVTQCHDDEDKHKWRITN